MLSIARKEFVALFKSIKVYLNHFDYDCYQFRHSKIIKSVWKSN